MKLIFTLFVVTFISYFSYAGELKITPEKPKEGSSVKFQYSPDIRINPGDNVFVLVYCFEAKSTMPTAYEVNLKYDINNKYFSGNFAVPQNTVYAISRISNGKIIDKNVIEYWDFLVYNKNGKPVPFANLKAGVAYMGNIPSFLEPVIDYEKALEFLKTEVNQNPGNLQAQIGLASLEFDMRKSTREEFENKINKFITSSVDYSDENNTRAAIRAMRTTNNNDKANKLESDFARNYPTSELAEEFALANLGKAASLDEFSKATLDFLKTYPNSSSKEKIYTALISGYTQVKKFDEINKILDEERNVPVSAYLKLAFELIKIKDTVNFENKENVQKAKFLIQKAIGLSKEIKSTDKPKYLTDTEWKLNMKMTQSSALEALGQINLEQKVNNEALNAYLEAKELSGDNATTNIYLSTIKTAFGLLRDTLAYNLATEAILDSKSNSEINEYHMLLFDSLKIAGNYKDLLDSLRDIAKIKRQSFLKYEMLNQSADDLPYLRNLAGTKEFNLASKGKITIIEFWTTWAAPCKNSLLALEELKSIFKKEIAVYAVNVWEKQSGQDRINEINKFFAQHKLTLPVLIDVKNELPLQLGISGLPTRIYIDADGKIQFKEMGYTDDSEYLRNAEDRIELMKFE